MKAKFKKTGEIVTIVSFSGNNTTRGELDYVDYIDSSGKRIYVNGLNYYFDFEEIDEFNNKEENTRLLIAKDIVCTLLNKQTDLNKEETIEEITDLALKYTDKLIKKWKK